MQIHEHPSDTIKADLCVVGGGMAGLCTAIAAARHGAKVVLIQDRPVLGGNASSEVRMWICGAHGRDAKETGLLEEILLENCYRNSELSYTVWDTILYEKARYQDGVQLLLNTAVCRVHAEGDGDQRRITAVEAWHLTRQAWIRVEATFFADCSGDSVLRTSGAEFRWGREARHEFDEPAAPEVADRKTMGNSLLLQLREIDPAEHTPFVPPAWAHSFPADHHRVQHASPNRDNFWWIEIGGEQDTQADADTIRDELYRIAFGVWAFIKNHPDGRGQKWELEWIGSLPGKRENVRYVGDHTLRQKEIEARGMFPDVVCHGGWTMDDHPPKAFNNVGVPTTFHPAPSPYGIPYRCLYSANVANLFFAGRNISCTHMAMSSTRVMATCATMGQAVGTAAALALKHRTSPRGVYQSHLNELQHLLLDDDQFLPGRARPLPAIAKAATITSSAGAAKVLRDGIDRRLGDDDHWLQLPVGGWIEYRFAAPTEVQRLRLVGDTQLHRDKRLPCRYPAKRLREEVPTTLARNLRIEGQGADGAWTVLADIVDNRRRLLVAPLAGRWQALKVTVLATWGAPTAGVFACDVGAAVTAGAIPDAPWLSKAITKGAHA